MTEKKLLKIIHPFGIFNNNGGETLIFNLIFFIIQTNSETLPTKAATTVITDIVRGSKVQPDFPFLDRASTQKALFIFFFFFFLKSWKGMLGHSGGRRSRADFGGD